MRLFRVCVGRRIKKKMSPIIMAIGAKLLLLVPLLLGGLALLAVKAAVIAKIALVLALFAGAGSIFGGGSGGWGGLGGKDIFSKVRVFPKQTMLITVNIDRRAMDLHMKLILYIFLLVRRW